jgi:shikimate kinase
MVGSKNIYLIGPMGSGKTAVGKYLARLLSCPFVDSDHEIERTTGADIPLIFEREGEAGFRKRERDMIAELVGRSGIVLATGGGAVLNEHSRNLLAANGWVVYLETSTAQQADRAARNRQRPLLHGHDPQQRLAELMKIRQPLYRSIADFTVSTDHQRVPLVAETVAAAYRRACAATSSVPTPQVTDVR